MIPQAVYTLNGTVKTIVFAPNEFTLFSQKWLRDEIVYKNPFTGAMTRKNRGYYYTGTLTFSAVDYDTLATYRDLFNSKITDVKLYPDKNSAEYYDVDMNDEVDSDDNDVAQAALNVALIFRSKNRYETPLNYPIGYWGDRHLTFQAAGNRTYGT
jgi:hypothetical protein